MPAVRTIQKFSGAYFTPDDVAASLVRWALRDEHDRLLDPSCGDGRFIAIRDEVSRYEAMTIALVEPKGDVAGTAVKTFPSEGSPLHLSKFFATLYHRYEERFVIGAPLLADRGLTTRFLWASDSPALNEHALPVHPTFLYQPRIASD